MATWIFKNLPIHKSIELYTSYYFKIIFTSTIASQFLLYRISLNSIEFHTICSKFNVNIFILKNIETQIFHHLDKPKIR